MSRLNTKARTKATRGAQGAAKATKGKIKRSAAADQPDGQTEQRILDAAHAVFLRRGTAGARMQDIAAEAGRQPGAPALLLPQQGPARAKRSSGAPPASCFPRVIAVMAPTLTLEDKVAQVVRARARSPVARAVPARLHHQRAGTIIPSARGQLISAADRHDARGRAARGSSRVLRGADRRARARRDACGRSRPSSSSSI